MKNVTGTTKECCLLVRKVPSSRGKQENKTLAADESSIVKLYRISKTHQYHLPFFLTETVFEYR